MIEQPQSEAVHEARVASRRLRVALAYVMPFYHVPEIKRIQRTLKTVTTTLGATRTLDVSRRLLAELGHGAGVDARPIRVDLDRSLEKGRQESAQRCMEVLRTAQLRRLGQEVEAILGAPHGHATPETLEKTGRRQVLRLEKEAWRDWKRYRKSRKKKDLHRLRITVKQARYGLEIYHEHHGGAVPEFLTMLGQAQSRLGRVHDLEMLARWLKGVRRGDIAVPGRHSEAWRAVVLDLREEARSAARAAQRRAVKLIKESGNAWKSIS